MKRTLLLLICLFAITTFTSAQSGDSLKTKAPKEIAVEINAAQTSLLSKKFYGINWNIKYFPAKRFGTGIYLIFFRRKINDTFSYRIQRPIIDYYEIGWINQYNFLQTNRVRMNISLINGVAQSRLGDNAIKERIHKNMPKEIASNYFYLLEPGAGISIRFASDKHDADFWLTSTASYHFVFGRTKYSTSKEFSNYLFGIGISIIGLH